MKKLVQLKNKENENLDPINLNYEKRIKKLEDNVYSTEETIVGTLNGQTIYRKVIQGVFTHVENTDTFIAAFDFDFSIVSFKGVVKSSNSIFWPIPNYYGLNIEYWCTVYQQGRGLYINGGKKYENSRFHLIIEYIKN